MSHVEGGAGSEEGTWNWRVCQPHLACRSYITSLRNIVSKQSRFPQPVAQLMSKASMIPPVPGIYINIYTYILWRTLPPGCELLASDCLSSRTHCAACHPPQYIMPNILQSP